MQFLTKDVVSWIFSSRDNSTLSSTGFFSARFSESATKRWFRKLSDMIRENCVYKCLSATDCCVLETLSSWGLTLLAFFPHASSCPVSADFCFLLPLPNGFLRLSLPTVFATVLKVFFYLWKPPQILAQQKPTSQPSTLLQLRRLSYRKFGIAVLTTTSASAPNPLLRCRLLEENCACVEAIIVKRRFR